MRLITAAKLPLYLFALLMTLPVFIAMAAIPNFWTRVFTDNNFLPHATCYLRNPQMVALHASSDFLIGLAYAGISATLAYMLYRARKDIPFQWMFSAFGIFIVACGVTHFMEVVTVWRPLYWAAGLIKAITAAASVATAVALPFLLPKVFSLIQTAKASESRRVQLEEAHAKLEDLYKKVKELDELKSRFFANVSHELRTPLTLVLGSADRIRHTPAASAVRHEAEGIKRNALVLLRNVNDLLDASKLDAGKMKLQCQRVDAGAFIRRVASNFSSLAEERSIAFNVSAPDGLIAEVDPEKVERALLNLLSNAFKFVPNGGEIEVHAEQAAGSLLVVVQDDGPGLPPSFLPKAFERFQQADNTDTRKHGGTGLGLSITKEFVELHGGSIGVRNVEPHGARFEFTLPLAAAKGTLVESEGAGQTRNDLAAQALAGLAPIPKQEARAARGTGALVLVAEDNPEMRQFIAETLNAEYRTSTAPNGREALRQLEAGPLPDLIVSDIMMPEMSGEQLLEQVRARSELADLPVIMLSAKAEEDLRVKLLRAGANDYLVKPFYPEELKARAQNLIALKQAREQLKDANQQLDQFNASVSHDLRAPLRSIKSFASFLREEHMASLDSAAKDYLRRITDNAERMSRLLEDLLSYSQITRMELKPERVSLQQALEQARASLEGQVVEAGAEIRLEGPLPDVVGNATVLNQAVVNLLGNAMKYVAPGVKPFVRISAEQRGKMVRVIIRDNGIGIEPKYHQKIFETFQRLHSERQYSGTGLGLALVKKGIERLGGQVGVDSEAGRGSAFWFELPAAPNT
ncbi:MAG TPA: ATP-binding protein [Methylomirabilota bacterium]|nr:ATP-binding protein [Methylomirabilota bacterium]